VAFFNFVDIAVSLGLSAAPQHLIPTGDDARCHYRTADCWRRHIARAFGAQVSVARLRAAREPPSSCNHTPPLYDPASYP
jgi:hypothetical protein